MLNQRSFATPSLEDAPVPAHQPRLPLRLTAASMLGVVIAIHGQLAPDHLREVPYIGASFVVASVVLTGVLLAVLGFPRALVTWWLGVAVCAAMAVAFVMSRTVGLPGLHESWTSDGYLGLVSIFAELAFIACAVKFMASRPATGSGTSTPQRAADIVELAGVVSDFFAAVSLVPGDRPNYPAARVLFASGATLVKNSGCVPEIWTVDQFLLLRQREVDSGALTCFQEFETAHVTEVFGNVGHRWSTYEKRGTRNGEAFKAWGKTSSQFIRTPTGWKVTSMVWDDARPGAGSVP